MATLTGTNGNDTLIGGIENDVINAIAGSDFVQGGAGNDLIVAGSGNDTVEGGDGNDTINAEAGIDSVLGDAGNDTILLDTRVSSVLTVNGLSFSDTNLSILESGDIANGGDGNDFIETSGGDFIWGGAGVDTVQIYANYTTANLNLDLRTNAAGVLSTTFGGTYTDVEFFAVRTGSGNDTILGSDQNETLDGGNGNNNINGGGGNDSIIARFGAETINGGDGTDIVRMFDLVRYNGGSLPAIDLDLTGDINVALSAAFNKNVSGFELVSASLSGLNDEVIGSALGDTMFGGAGGDLLDGRAGNDGLLGEISNDTLLGGLGADLLNGGNDQDVVFGDHSAVIVDQEAYLVFGSTANEVDTLIGGFGFDWLASTGGDNVNGDDGTGNGGFDTLYLDVSAFSTAINLDLSSATPINNIVSNAFGGTYSNIETFRFWLGSGQDTFTGGTANDHVSGGLGNDSLVGGLGDDLLISGGGNDTLMGGSGNDFLYQLSVQSVDQFGNIVLSQVVTGGGLLDGGVGDDFVEVSSTGTTIIGGTGTDTLEVSIPVSTAISLNLSGDANAAISSAFGLNVTGFEQFWITLGTQNDTFIGSAGADYVDGGLGNDLLTGGAGNDTFALDLDAGEADTITDFQAGLDILDLENDITSFSNNLDLDADGQFDDARVFSNGGSVVLLNASFGLINGTPGNDFIQGSTGNDTIFGLDGNDTLDGLEGADSLEGGAGDDFIMGGNGNNIIWGGTGNDTIFGGSGNELFLGGDGNDVFVFDLATGNDTIFAGLGRDTFSLNHSGTINIADYQERTDSIALNGEFSFNVSRVIENFIDADGDGQSDDARATFTSLGGQVGVVNFLNSTHRILTGTNNADYLIAGFDFDTINGLDGNDTIEAGDGANRADGGSGNDRVVGRFGNDTLLGGSGNDILTNGNNVFFQSISLAMTEFSGASDLDRDSMDGGDGDDLIVSGLNDSATGGAGTDILLADFSPESMARTLNLAGGTAQDVLASNNMNVSGFEIYGFWMGSGNDLVVGSGDGELIGGGFGNDTLYGNGGVDSLIGGWGADFLDGGIGADSMFGGDGNDIYLVNSSSDIVLENQGQGQDTVFVTTSYALSLGTPFGAPTFPVVPGAAVEILAALNAGSTIGLALSGNEFNNQIIGAAGSDTLIGVTRATADIPPHIGQSDTMFGLGGDDFYYVGSSLDVVIEAVGNGFDAVFASSNFSLAINSEVEILLGVLGAGTLGLSLTGNNLNNQIIGTSGNDTLIGGTGNDTLVGGLGNDVYRVDQIGDVVVENASAGNDTIQTTFNYTLLEGLEIETLEALNRGQNTGPGGGTMFIPFIGPDGVTIMMPIPVPPTMPGAPSNVATPISLTGNSFANSVLGTESGDTLDGGAGADWLVGYGGDDFYYVDNALDVVTEAANGGKDIVFATNSFTLGAGSEVEILAHANAASLTPLYLAGNDLANQVLGGGGGDGLYGFGGNDSLYGFGGNDLVVGGLGEDYVFGGAGADTLIGGQGGDWLIGGAGNDVFKFTSAGDSLVLARDTITDFETGVDKLDFTGFTTAAGNPISGPFSFGTLAAGTGPRIQIGADISNGYSRILADADGDGNADFELWVSTSTPAAIPVAGDFIL